MVLAGDDAAVVAVDHEDVFAAALAVVRITDLVGGGDVAAGEQFRNSGGQDYWEAIACISTSGSPPATI